MELYYEIGRAVSNRLGKGAAVAAAEHLQSAFPEMSGFSPRNLRRMRKFFCAYEGSPEVLNEAMTIGWTQNVVILESDLMLQERRWYIQAVQRLGWSRTELLRKIESGAHLQDPLDLTNEMCYIEGNDSSSAGCGNNEDMEEAMDMKQNTYQTKVVTGPALLDMAENVRGWEKRDCYRQLNAYLYGKCSDKVCLLFGLRRTGKTTMLRQAMPCAKRRLNESSPTQRTNTGCVIHTAEVWPGSPLG